MNIGWKCPVCGCGNSPQAMVCGKCAPEIRPIVVPLPYVPERPEPQQPWERFPGIPFWRDRVWCVRAADATE